MRFHEKELLIVYLIFDLLILNIAIALTCYLNHQLMGAEAGAARQYFLHANLAWIITYFVFSKKNLYLRDDFLNRVIRILRRTVIFLLVAGVLGFVFQTDRISRLFLIEYTGFFMVGKLVFYGWLYTWLKRRRIRGLHSNRVLIVGLNDTSRYLRRVIDHTYMLGYQFVGYVSKHTDNDADVIGTPDELEALILDHRIQLVFVTLSLFSNSGMGKEYLRVCNKLGVMLRFVPENQTWFRSRLNMESVGELVIINPQHIPLDNLEHRFVKRAFDIVFSLAMMVLLFSWLFPILAIAIKVGSRGPVFFVQERTGINNKTFRCLKFRSMKPSLDAHTRQARAGDDRITRLGHFMRRYNIDELPQFLNVLVGNMSVVGPRPHMLRHTDEYSHLIDYYRARHYVKPGITGWAQVNGYRGETDELWKMEKRVEFDMDYIENWSFWMDVKIVVLTTFGRKAYHNAV